MRNERRRMMMSDDSFVRYLKSIGCQSYFPLTNGDMKDHISGQTLQLTGNGSMVWDANKNMYLVTTPSSMNLHVADGNFSFTSEFTIIALIHVLDRNVSYPNDSGFPVGNNNNKMLLLNSAGEMWAKHWPADVCVVATWAQGDAYEVYYDGSVKRSIASGSTWAPSVMNTTSFKLGYSNDVDTRYGKSTNRRFYIKHLMFFNNKLTSGQIGELTNRIKSIG